MLQLSEWTPAGNVAEIIDVAKPAGWDQIRDWYTDGTPVRPLERLIELATEHGVVSVLVERRYVDADWRSEHSRFFGGTFKRYPTVCHRLHFFTKTLSHDLGDLSTFGDSYRGYSVMRPLAWAPVGRTMISPPPELSGATVAGCVETVHLFDATFQIMAMPFISQDAQFLRCAHASIWMVLRHAHLKHGLEKRLTGDVRDAAVGGQVVGRQLPSDGLSLSQMLNALDSLGLSAGALLPDAKGAPEEKSVPGSLSLYAIVCRQINSGLPPIVVSKSHAWVVVAWSREPSAGHSRLTLWRHDDSCGPYIKVDDPWDEPQPAHTPWDTIITPLLPKMNIDAERAEAVGAALINYVCSEMDEECKNTRALRARGALTFRTFAVRAWEYKSNLRHRGLDSGLLMLYRVLQMPRYIWVVEAVDKDARDAHQPDVVGEVILDSTHAAPSDLKHASILAGHLEGYAFSMNPDEAAAQILDVSSTSNYLGDRDVR